jgi:hypothetical protein
LTLALWKSKIISPQHQNLNSKWDASHFESNYILRTILLEPIVTKNGNGVIVMCFHPRCLFFIKHFKHCTCSTLSKIMAQGLCFKKIVNKRRPLQRVIVRIRSQFDVFHSTVCIIIIFHSKCCILVFKCYNYVLLWSTIFFFENFCCFFNQKNEGKVLEKCIFPRVNLTKFPKFFGNFCQHFDIKKIWKKKKKKTW